MSPVAFLLSFLFLSVIGALVMWARDREPRSMEAHMKAFERQLDALSPETPIEHAAGPARATRPTRPARPAPARHRRPPTRPRTRGSRPG